MQPALPGSNAHYKPYFPLMYDSRTGQNAGGGDMMNYTVIGDSVNKVKRLQEMAQGGQILISQVTYHLVQEYIEAQPLGNVQLKGQPYPEMVYEVLKVN